MRDEPDQPPEHYFSASPASADERRPLRVHLDGRELELVTAPSVFSGHRLDLGTAVLLDLVGDPPADGDLLDLGCGWGPVALTLAMRSPEPATRRVWAVDVNERARDLTAANAASLGLRGVRTAAPEEVDDEARFAAIWSNPPIRIGKPALHALLLHWLPRLAPGGSAHLVVAKDLGADSLQRWIGEQGEQHGWTAERSGSRKGFRVLEVRRSG
ncbi:methyltransferase [Streptomyces sp. NP160]|uniref:class I SAM-dependent methyltransferase n=1 Tax=Streptomyces sp. NP160 TaxID=2586637 RepID=UPI00111AA063|nr:methyltransferase [Streptomyces sp. NP160]TNM60681.1 methyltransferase [Streptomyces sp. NP160]